MEMLPDTATEPLTLEEYRVERAKCVTELEAQAPELQRAVRHYRYLPADRRERIGRDVAKALYAKAKAEEQMRAALLAAMRAEIAEEAHVVATH